MALVVPDYDAAIRFFVEVLGFRLTEDIPQGHKRWVTVEPAGGGARLVLAQAEGPEQAAAIGNQSGGRVWLFLHTDDFARDQARMQAAGVIFEEAPPRRTLWHCGRLARSLGQPLGPDSACGLAVPSRQS